MTRTSGALAAAALVATLAFPAPPASADEGMWTFNGFPAERFQAAYGFAPSQEWLDHVRLSSVRFNNGGSGSFVSADGLAITNHHVGSDCIQKLSSAERDLMKDGFVANGLEEELACPDLELNVLQSIDRVTERIRAATAGTADAARAGELRRAEMARIEEECQTATGLRCDVVTLYEGGEVDLYRYRRFTDVRLVFAPELQLASFGGDPDNFEYPRFCLDFSLFRVWEDGKPARVANHLRFDPAGPEEGEVLFVSGHPGSTSRLDSLAQLEWLRDTSYPNLLTRLDGFRTDLLAFSARGPEQARIAADDILGIENSLKAVSGYLSGLLDPALMARKADEEARLRAAVAADPDRFSGFGDPWAEIEGALETYRTFLPRSGALGGLTASDLSGTAATLVLLAAEREKPSPERLREFRETALPSLFQNLYSEAPIYPEYEELRLGRALRAFQLQYGPVHPLVVRILGDREPADLARELIAGTRLADVAARRALVEGGKAAVDASTDPLIRLFRELEPALRELRKLRDDQVDAVERRAGEKIAEAYFAVAGRDTYPDATFTLRLSYGRALGYEEGGTQVPWVTHYGGLFERSAKFGAKPPYDLPAGLAARADQVDRSVPVNFVTTHDIIGGNSGSPVVDRDGAFVGIIFDGNLYGLPNRFVYTDRQARSTSVHAAAIVETLTNVYPQARRYADELRAGKRRE